MRAVPDLGVEDYVATVAVARLLLGPRMRLQVPPNLSDPTELGLLLRAGVDDWGGVSPLTPDHVNPERPWPHLDDLTRLTADAGFTLVERLTAHPEYVLAPEPWLDPRVRPHVAALADPATGLGVEGRCPTGLPWQEPDPDWGSVAAGRVDLHVEVDTIGRTDDRRSDFDAVYGDWAAVGEQVDARQPAAARTPGGRRPGGARGPAARARRPRGPHRRRVPRADDRDGGRPRRCLPRWQTTSAGRWSVTTSPTS